MKEINTSKELFEWITTTSNEIIKNLFIKMDFHKCFFYNFIDRQLKDKGIRFREDKTIDPGGVNE